MNKFLSSVVVFMLMLTFGCNSESEETRLNEKVDSLQTRLDSLEKNLNEFKDSPEYLIGQAHQAYSKGEYEMTQEILWKIQKDYPEWNKFLILEYLGQIAEIIDEKKEPPFKD